MASGNLGLTYGGQEKTPSLSGETEFAAEAGAPGGLFHADYKRHDDLKQMLDSSKDSLKLEAMKRIIGMVAKGRDASDLFPAVVKNVVSKNIEVKKLVYVYLVRYAEEQQDLALLSISTFQRALKDPNQLIRASALRVLSSIRVPVIVPIMMLAIRDSVSDMSPYVRKTAAHAIPKLYDLDPEQKDELVMVIERLLSDQTTLVVGSAVMAFEQVCPERTDLIHKNFRKLCAVLVDVEEWGQVIIIGMLTRYARTQFTDPNINGTSHSQKDKPFYEDSEEDDEKSKQRESLALDSDHRLLLRNTKPLLQSRNSSVVMAVAQLYHHLAPKEDVAVVTRALIRLLRSHREVQTVVLNSIASMSVNRKDMFEPFLKNFFVRNTDATQIKLLKLEILTNLANESNITFILREFQTYISSQDRDLVAATIQAIGRCAAGIKEVTDTCLSGLIALLSNSDELVVAESVVVIKKLLQTQQGSHGDIVGQMARLVNRITVPQARAAILWLVGEHCEKKRVSKMAPDVLRFMARSFANEPLSCACRTPSKLKCYANMSLAWRNMIKIMISEIVYAFCVISFSRQRNKQFLLNMQKKIFLASKPPPVIESVFKDRDEFQLGSLSHYLNSRVVGYMDLPSFPAVAPDSSVRNVESPRPTIPVASVPGNSAGTSSKGKKMEAFYSESSSEDEERNEESGSSDSKSDSSSETESGSAASDSDASTSDEEDDDDSINISQQNIVRLSPSLSPSPPSHRLTRSLVIQSSSESQYSSNSSDSDSSISDTPEKVSPRMPLAVPKSNLDLLLDLDVSESVTTPVMASIPGIPFASLATTPNSDSSIQPASAVYISTRPMELVSSVSSGCSLQILYRYSRSVNLYSASMVTIELTLINTGNEDLAEIKIANKNMPVGISMHEFTTLASLPAGATRLVTLGIDFGDSTQTVSCDLVASGRPIRINFRPSVGELIRPVTCSEGVFINEQGKLKGMNEHSFPITNMSELGDVKNISAKLFRASNMASISSSEQNTLRFAGQTLSSKSLVLVTIMIGANPKLTVCCEKMIIGSMLLAELKEALKN
ncbi:AP-3 complex subunit beta [Daphnia magna]|uniref:AP-3 complex subunit beta n=1 Tax=Daphnia magna TaxID=35525 RepID=A0A162NQ33_9CRUS|nr:AP-3 complex subunit beta [Daphnia magna]